MHAAVLPALIASGLIGTVIGIGGYTFIYAKGGSYLTNDPAACANCHVMEEHYSGWIKSSHRAVATCNDCHTPHNLIAKYAVKAENGFWHSFYFTTGGYPDVIRARPISRRITENACRRCHQEIAADMISLDHASTSLSCLHCHDEVGHPR